MNLYAIFWKFCRFSKIKVFITLVLIASLIEGGAIDEELGKSKLKKVCDLYEECCQKGCIPHDVNYDECY